MTPPVLWTSHVKMLAGRLEGAHPNDAVAREAAATLRALAAERDALRALSNAQADILADKGTAQR